VVAEGREPRSGQPAKAQDPQALSQTFKN